MLKKSAQSFLTMCSRYQLVQPFSSHGPTPQKLNKVTDTTVKFNVKNASGQWEEVHAYVGESFLSAIERMKVKGFDYLFLCHGNDQTYRPHERPYDPFSSGPACGSCRINLKDNWFQKVNEQTDGMTQNEETLLLRFADIRKDTRLACCIPVEGWMNGCTFEVMPDPEISELTKLI